MKSWSVRFGRRKGISVLIFSGLYVRTLQAMRRARRGSVKEIEDQRETQSSGADDKHPPKPAASGRFGAEGHESA